MIRFCKTLTLLSTALVIGASGCQQPDIYICTSPDANIRLFADSGKFSVTYYDQKVLTIEKFGFDNCIAPDFSYVQAVTDDYTMLTGKKAHCRNLASEYSAALNPNIARVQQWNSIPLPFAQSQRFGNSARKNRL